MGGTLERANTGGIAARRPLAPAAIEQAGRNRRGEGLDTGPFSQRPPSAKSGDSIGKSAGLSTRIAKTPQTVRKAARLKLSTRIRETYSLADLAQVFGVHLLHVETWASRGLLGRARGIGGDARFTEVNVQRFVRKHARHYDLGRVNRVWFKAMIFGYPGILRGRALRRRRNAI